MSKSEIALELTLAMLEKGMYIAQAHDNNAAFGKAVAELYNYILKSLDVTEQKPLS